MAQHVIVGAGPVGTATAAALIEQGHRVRVITRRRRGARAESRPSGSPPTPLTRTG